MLALVLREFASALKEVDEGPVQMPQALLQGHRGHLSQPGGLLLCFPQRQERREVAVGEPLARFPVGGGLAGQGPIVDPPTTAKGPGKHLALFGRGVESGARGTFDQAHREAFLFCRKEAETGAPLSQPARNERAWYPYC